MLKVTITQPTDHQQVETLFAADVEHAGQLVLDQLGSDNTPEFLWFDEDDQVWGGFGVDADEIEEKPQLNQDQLRAYVSYACAVPERYVDIEDIPTFSGPGAVVAARTLMGLSTKELAQILGVNERTVRDWEAGVHGMKPRLLAQLMQLVHEHDQFTAKVASNI